MRKRGGREIEKERERERERERKKKGGEGRQTQIEAAFYVSFFLSVDSKATKSSVIVICSWLILFYKLVVLSSITYSSTL